MIYLYIKTHNKTGLKYLGKTSQKDPFKYTGSGKYWKLHCKKHGYDINTEIIFQTEIKEEIEEKGLFYSKLWDVVNSEEWANLKPESGDGGSVLGKQKSEEHKQKLSISQKGKPRDQIYNTAGLIEAKKIKRKCDFCNREFDLGNYGKYHGEKCKLNPNVDPNILTERSNHAKKAGKASVNIQIKNGYNFHTEEAKQKALERIKSKETREKMSISQKNRFKLQKGKDKT